MTTLQPPWMDREWGAQRGAISTTENVDAFVSSLPELQANVLRNAEK